MTYFIPRWINQYKIKRWIKALNLKQHEAVFEIIYQSTNGFVISREARKHGDAMAYTYGEIDFLSFIALISMTRPHPDTRFYDLGSGTGKAVLACALVFEMREYCGIELFEKLHEAAQVSKQVLQTYPDYLSKVSQIRFIQGDFLTMNLQDATLIFINAAAFFGSMWERLEKQLEGVASGTVLVTISRAFKTSYFAVIKRTTVKMSWGVATAYIHERV